MTTSRIPPVGSVVSRILTVPLPDGSDPEHSDSTWIADIEVPSGWYRTFWSPELGGDHVRVVADQYVDGSIGDVSVSLGSCEVITPTAARETAAALIAAADLADQWKGSVR